MTPTGLLSRRRSLRPIDGSFAKHLTGRCWEVADNGDNFLELDLDMFQTCAVRPIVRQAQRNRKGILLMSAAPNAPGPWRLEIVALSQRGCEKLRRLIKEELQPGD